MGAGPRPAGPLSRHPSAPGPQPTRDPSAPCPQPPSIPLSPAGCCGRPELQAGDKGPSADMIFQFPAERRPSPGPDPRPPGAAPWRWCFTGCPGPGASPGQVGWGRRKGHPELGASCSAPRAGGPYRLVPTGGSLQRGRGMRKGRQVNTSQPTGPPSPEMTEWPSWGPGRSPVGSCPCALSLRVSDPLWCQSRWWPGPEVMSGRTYRR